MKMNKPAALLLAALALPVAAAQMNMGSMGGMKMGTSGMASLEKKTGRAFDIAFMSQMIEHHQGAIEMARDAQKYARRAEVKQEAAKIIRDQGKEIAQMTAWLKSWYNTAPVVAERNLVKSDMGSMISETRSAMTPMVGMTMDADKAFLEGMIPHHQGAIDMSNLALKKAARAELKKLAQNIVSAQRREIQQYRQWLDAWY